MCASLNLDSLRAPVESLVSWWDSENRLLCRMDQPLTEMLRPFDTTKVSFLYPHLFRNVTDLTLEVTLSGTTADSPSRHVYWSYGRGQEDNCPRRAHRVCLTLP